MEHSHSRIFAGDAEVKKFPTPLVPYRAFHCSNCRVYLVVCSRCDRNLIYCPSCRVEKKKIRNRKSNKIYRATAHGKRMRALNERRRRARRREFVANQGSPLEQISAMPPVPAIPGGQPTEGEYDEISSVVEGQSEAPAEVASGKHAHQEGQVSKKIFCSFCQCQCLEFQRFSTGARWRKEKRRIAGKGMGNFNTS